MDNDNAELASLRSQELALVKEQSRLTSEIQSAQVAAISARATISKALTQAHHAEWIVAIRMHVGESQIVAIVLTIFGAAVGSSGGLFLGSAQPEYLIGSCVGLGLLGGILTGHLLLLPGTERLRRRARSCRRFAAAHAAAPPEAPSKIANLQWQLSRVKSRIHELRVTIDQLENRFEKWQAEVAVRNRTLLLEDWQSMKGVGFENWLVRLFTNLGGDVETTTRTADHGADLIVHFRGHKVVVQAKGWANSVGNKAVMEAAYGKQYHNATICAVVTNSSFTAAARDGATRVRCLLVDAARMNDLANAKIAYMRGREPTN